MWEREKEKKTRHGKYNRGTAHCSSNISNCQICVKERFGYLLYHSCEILFRNMPLYLPHSNNFAIAIIINVFFFRSLQSLFCWWRWYKLHICTFIKSYIDAIIRHEKQRCHCGNNLCMWVRVCRNACVCVCLWLCFISHNTLSNHCT